MSRTKASGNAPVGVGNSASKNSSRQRSDRGNDRTDTISDLCLDDIRNRDDRAGMGDGEGRVSQNVSTAVMQRRVEAHDSLDDFPSPPWATRALCEHVIWPSGAGWPKKLDGMTVWEPACNRGHMVKPLREYFASVHASDIYDYSAEWPGQERVSDFLFPGSEPPHIAANGVDWIITNPPFRLASQFIERARGIARIGVAVIVRSAFLEGVGRYQELFSKNPPSIIAQFTERVVMVKGRLEPKGSTATSYSWLVWVSGNTDTRFVWVPPCRKSLERASDYSEAA